MPTVQKINFEPHTEDNRLQDKNHSEKNNTSTLNDSRGQEREIQVSRQIAEPGLHFLSTVVRIVKFYQTIKLNAFCDYFQYVP